MVLSALCIISGWIATQEGFDCFTSLSVLAMCHFEYSYPGKGEWHLPSVLMTPFNKNKCDYGNVQIEQFNIKHAYDLWFWALMGLNVYFFKQ